MAELQGSRLPAMTHEIWEMVRSALVSHVVCAVSEPSVFKELGEVAGLK